MFRQLIQQIIIEDNLAGIAPISPLATLEERSPRLKMLLSSFDLQLKDNELLLSTPPESKLHDGKLKIPAGLVDFDKEKFRDEFNRLSHSSRRQQIEDVWRKENKKFKANESAREQEQKKQKDISDEYKIKKEACEECMRHLSSIIMQEYYKITGLDKFNKMSEEEKLDAALVMPDTKEIMEGSKIVGTTIYELKASSTKLNEAKESYAVMQELYKSLDADNPNTNKEEALKAYHVKFKEDNTQRVLKENPDRTISTFFKMSAYYTLRAMHFDNAASRFLTDEQKSRRKLGEIKEIDDVPKIGSGKSSV